MSYQAEDDLYARETEHAAGVEEESSSRRDKKSGGVVGRGGGLYETGKRASTLAGRSINVDKRLFKYDVRAGDKNPLPFAVTKDDRMSAVEAGERLDYIHKILGVDKESHEVLSALDKSLFFCHTINGASVLNPGRAVFSVPEKTEVFDYAKVREILGVDFRRFFRAFADETRMVNQAVLRNFDPYDVESAEVHGWLLQVANERGLSRYPDLAHDSADACTTLTISERAAVAASKVAVLATTVNAADQVKANSRTMSADRYDSTLGKTV